MKVKTSKETVEKVMLLLKTYDASSEEFLNDLPTPEKYAILAIAMIVKGSDNLEEAYHDATHQVSAQDLTKHLLNYPFLWCHLQDALALKLEHFEVRWSEHEEDEENEGWL